MNKIQLCYCQEDLKSRVAGVFPYLEFDENGTCHLRSAEESIEGCYGKLVPSITLPPNVSLVVDGVVILCENTSYNYRTLSNYYYKYKEMKYSTFIAFFERGIGRYMIDAEIDYSVCDLVPEYGYYSEANSLYEEYTKMKNACEYYLNWKEATGEVNCEYECLIDKFDRMGGDTMRLYYQSKIEHAKELEDEYLTYADVDSTSFSLNINITQSNNDLGTLSLYLNYWEPGVQYSPGTLVTYNGRTYICTSDTIGKWDEYIQDYVFDDDNFELVIEHYDNVPNTYTVTGSTNSQLKSFRNSRTYVGIDGISEEPETNEDWLWYYKLGEISHYETTTDNVGNIVIDNGYQRATNIGDIETHLMAYGDVINNIEVTPQDNTITFTYILGAHLKATYLGSDTDDDGNLLYYYGDYVYDDADIHGVVYTDTYEYQPNSELERIINKGLFPVYIKDESLLTYSERVLLHGADPDFGISYKYFRCAFDVDSATRTSVAIVNGSEVSYNFIHSDFYTVVENNKDSLAAALTKHDYLTGSTYQPIIKKDVNINRGNAASWERHLKLGEVKSFDDLENYANGGFFNIQ